MAVSTTSVDTKALLESLPTGLFIGGEWRDASSGETFDVQNPATGEVLATLQSANSDDALVALDTAVKVQKDWARTPARQRSEILARAYQLVTERTEEFAALMTLEMGKPLAEARGEVKYGAEYLRWFSEETVRQYGNSQEVPEGGIRMVTRRKPVGPCLLITPWNFPLAMATRKVAPAIAAGCTMVLKPAELTPLTTQYFVQTMIEAGLPAGVLNVVCGTDPAAISEPLIDDPRLRKVSFTGSTAVGKILMKQAADGVLRTSMELGGNAPFIVFEDADIDQAVAGAMAAKMRNIGEACTAANRFLVHKDVADEFTDKLVAAMEKLTVGNGMDDGVDVGPLIEEKARQNIAGLIEDAKKDGATVLTGGEAINGDGFFFQPTVLRGASTDSRIFQEEIFGPVASIYEFTDEDEVIDLANSTPYGLASYIFSENSDRMWRLADGLEFGIVGFNAGVVSNAAVPFGGVKQSGQGREGGAEGLDEYTEVQYIGVRDPYANK